MTDETKSDEPTGAISTPTHTPPPAPTAPAGAPKPPPTNVGWAVAAVVFFWPLAFSAFTNALNVTQYWLTGQFDRAQESSDRAKLLGKIALLTGLVLLFLFIAVRIACAIWWHTHGGGGGWGHHGGGHRTWDDDGWNGPGPMGRPGHDN
ncbi:CD225/dispanin family protein [Mycobacteroides salmoniphilum]|uniref:CD225/dispanin family protein n=1 Tax=Mycobacteroides salmoniphilum TaxID=404941 RepID=UPI000993A37F|nr:CD225/dispanin family protein [Mycobacteroides salmoniphilum]